MTNNEFYNEVIKSDLCPNNFTNNFYDFLEFKDKILDVLNEIHYLCEKNNLFYELAYGSLLGVVRDNSSIPWDYDIDIFALFEERERFVNVLKNQLNDKYYFICKEVDENCRNTLIRVTLKGYNSNYYHVDIFFLSGIPSSDDFKTRKKIYELSEKYFYKKVKFDLHEFSFKGIIKQIIFKMLYLTKNSKSIWNEYYELCSSLPVKESTFCVSAESCSMLYKFESKDILERKLIKVNNKEYMIPKAYEKILNEIYGDYKKYPSLESRIKEFSNSITRLKKYSKL